MASKKGLFSFLNIESLVDHLYGFIDSKIEIVKIETKAEIAHVVARMLLVGILLTFFLFFIVFITFFIADKINHAYPGKSYGYLSVAAFYLFLMLSTLLANKIFNLEQQIQEVFLKLLNKKRDNEDS